MRRIILTLSTVIAGLSSLPCFAQTEREDRLFCDCLRSIRGKVIANEYRVAFDTIGCFLEGKLLDCRLQPIAGSVVVESRGSGEKTIYSVDSSGVFKGWIKHNLYSFAPYNVTITAPGHTTFQLDSYTFKGGACRFEVLLGDDGKSKLKVPSKQR